MNIKRIKGNIIFAKKYEDIIQEHKCLELLVQRLEREKGEYSQELKTLKKNIEKEAKKKNSQQQKAEKEFVKNPKNLTNFQSKEELIESFNEVLEENGKINEENNRLTQELSAAVSRLKKEQLTEQNFKALQRELDKVYYKMKEINKNWACGKHQIFK